MACTLIMKYSNILAYFDFQEFFEQWVAIIRNEKERC